MKKTVVSGLMITLLSVMLTSAFNIQPVKSHSDPPDYVKFYVYNPGRGDNIYIGKPYPQVTFVEVWIDSPVTWENTPIGIVAYELSLRVDPNVVEVLAAQKYPDFDFSGYSDGFLENFVERYLHGYYTLFVEGTIDKPSGTITGTTELIVPSPGVGAGGGPEPLMRYVIRTSSTADPTSFSPLDLFDCYYITVDGVEHTVDIVEDGYYNTPPPVPEFPIGLALEILFMPVIIYMLWNSKYGKKMLSQDSSDETKSQKDERKKHKESVFASSCLIFSI